MIVRIESALDARVADYRDVKEARLFKERGVFVAEGIEVVRTLFASPRFSVRSVLCTERNLSRLLEHTERAPIYVAPPEVLSAVAGFDVHRGCLALGERSGIPAFESLLETVAKEQRSTVLILEALADHDNVGALFRNARGFGAAAVFLDRRCADPLYRKAIRVSMGGALLVPFARMIPWPGALDLFEEKGYTLCALTPSEDAEDLGRIASGRAPPLPEKLALAFGAEGTGLSREVLERARRRWRIPMAPDADSINVAVASAVALFALDAGAKNRPEPRENH